VSSLGDTRVLATTSMVMALVGLLGTGRLLPRAIRAGNFARAFPKRNSNLAFVAVAVSIYSIQLILAVALLLNSQSAELTRVTAFVIVALFVNALGRAWVVAGISHLLRFNRTNGPTILFVSALNKFNRGLFHPPVGFHGAEPASALGGQSLLAQC
jgi:hypothetical protein